MKKLILMIMLASCNYVYGYDVETFAPPKESGSTQATTVIRYTQPNSKRMILFMPGGVGYYRTITHPIDDSKGFLAFLKMISTTGGVDVGIVLSPYPLKVNMTTWYPYMRDTADHLDRMESVVRQYQKTHEVWLMGHSHGTSSVTAFMRRMAQQKDTTAVKGLVMISTGNTAQFDYSPETPVLFVHHVNDGCPGSVFDIAQSNFNNVRQINSHSTKLVALNNVVGDISGDPCYNGYHMLRESHVEASSAIVNFMKEAQ